MPEKPSANLKEQFIVETIPVGFPWRLLIFSFIIFAFSVFIYFGLQLGYETYLKTRVDTLDKNINELASEISQEEQQTFINFYSQLVNLKKVLDRHKFSANIFTFLERNTLAGVYYTEATLSADQPSLTLRGVAASAEALIGQLNILDKAAELTNVRLDQMAFEGAQANFNITIIFKPEFFNRPT